MSCDKLVERTDVAPVGLLAGFGMASLLVRWINERAFRYVATAVIIAGGAVLLGRELTRL